MGRADRVSAKPLLDKLGVNPGARVTVLGVGDPGFLRQLRERGADVSSRPRKDSDLVFFLAESRRDLDRLPALEASIVRTGAIWVVSPRGRPEIRDVHVIAAALAAGLVDNKVVRFSDTHTALRLVVPRARR